MRECYSLLWQRGLSVLPDSFLLQTINMAGVNSSRYISLCAITHWQWVEESPVTPTKGFLQPKTLVTMTIVCFSPFNLLLTFKGEVSCSCACLSATVRAWSNQKVAQQSVLFKLGDTMTTCRTGSWEQ